MIRELWRCASEQGRGLLIAIVALSLLSAALEAIALACLAPLMGVLTDSSPAFLRWPLNEIGARFVSVGRRESVFLFAALLAGMMTLKFAVVAANLALTVELEMRVVRHLRLRCLAVLFFSPQSFIDEYDNARIVQHFNEQSLRSGEVLRNLLRALTNVASFALNVAILLMLSIQLTVAVLIILTVLSAVIAPVPRLIATNARRFLSSMYDYNVRLGDLIAGIKMVRSYATFGREKRLVREVMEQQISAHRRKIYFSMITAPIFEVLGFISLCAILAASVIAIPPTLWLTLLAPFIVILARTIPQATALNSVRSILQVHASDYNALRDFTRQLSSHQHAQIEIRGRFETIELDHVSFSYGRGKQVLSDLSLRIRRGDRVLLTGASGAGKTTILNLMLGLYEPSFGVVKLNGLDLKTVDREQWAQNVGIVEQTPYVLNDTIRANIAYRDESIKDDAINKALRAVGLQEFVEELPNGLETELGDYGSRLSGGQRQRLAFARALSHCPDLLILDEPTSALDSATESSLIRGVTTEYPGITLIAVSHSEAMGRLFDTVLHLKNGRVEPLQPAAAAAHVPDENASYMS
jgi:ABC-type multidrug transport system fused ATPase/permease subunit